GSWVDGPFGVRGLMLVGVVGFLVGAFLARCIRRFNYARSAVWPLGRYCDDVDGCFGRLPWYSGVPLVGGLLLRFRCPHCKVPILRREAVVAPLTAALFVGLFALHVEGQGRYLPQYNQYSYDWDKLLAMFVYHALLTSFLIAATFIDLEVMQIPDEVTIPGTALGILLGTFWFVELHPVMLWQPPPFAGELMSQRQWAEWFGGAENVPAAAEAFRAWLAPIWMFHWNKIIGFATGVVGAAGGFVTVWTVRAVAGWAFNKEAIGFGDVTLMMMVGAFTGWQTVVLIFFLAPASAMFSAFVGVVFFRSQELPYGPHLSIATLVVLFAWNPVWAGAYPNFQFGVQFVLLGLLGMLTLLAIVAKAVSYVGRMIRRVRRAKTHCGEGVPPARTTDKPS
ncbi:MAG: prepilin peptidase, partial [Planctomycetia bacterium]